MAIVVGHVFVVQNNDQNNRMIQAIYDNEGDANEAVNYLEKELGCPNGKYAKEYGHWCCYRVVRFGVYNDSQ